MTTFEKPCNNWRFLFFFKDRSVTNGVTGVSCLAVSPKSNCQYPTDHRLENREFGFRLESRLKAYAAGFRLHTSDGNADRDFARLTELLRAFGRCPKFVVRGLVCDNLVVLCDFALKNCENHGTVGLFPCSRIV